MGSEGKKGLAGAGLKPWKTLFVTVVCVVSVYISIIHSAGELSQDEFVKPPSQDAKWPEEKVSKELDRDALPPEIDVKTKPTIRYPGIPAASWTPRRASTLDLRNPAALEIVKSQWKCDEKIIHLFHCSC